MSEELIRNWIADLDTLDWAKREIAKTQLLAQGKKAVPQLIDAMLSQTPRQCWEAASILAQIDDPRWFEPMRNALTNPHPILGQTAARAMLDQGERGLDALLKALPDARHAVQVEMVRCIEIIQDQRAVQPLIALIGTVDSPVLRYTIIQALGILGDTSAIPIIRPFLDDPDHHVSKRAHIAFELLTKASDKL